SGLDANDSKWPLLKDVLSYLGASSSSTLEGGESKYNFTYYYNNGSGDYYTGYVYAPTSFKTSGPQLSVGREIYNEPAPMGGASLGGSGYYITAITDGYDSSYDKLEYITSYYDSSTSTAYEVLPSASSISTYIDGHIKVQDRSTTDEGGYIY